MVSSTRAGGADMPAHGGRARIYVIEFAGRNARRTLFHYY